MTSAHYRRASTLVLLCASAVAGQVQAEEPAQAIANKGQRVEVIAVPHPLPLPGQLKPLPAAPVPQPAGSPQNRVVAANAAARVQPIREGFINAMQIYPWSEGALYQVYTAPGHVTDIALQPGETLTGAGPVAAGDTARWVIGDTISGTGDTQRVHILAKPVRQDLVTNLVVNTNHRTYHIELRATPATYMASVAWTYPQDQLMALQRRNADIAAKVPIAAGIDIAALNFAYSIDGDKVGWKPVRVFDDGRQTFVEFPQDVAQGEMPPIFVLDAEGGTELVNYRVQDRFMVVDRIFAAAELRMGDRKTERHVRIARLPTQKGRR